jgi:hypothetical protein
VPKQQPAALSGVKRTFHEFNESQSGFVQVVSTFRFYAADWSRFLECFFGRGLSLRFGTYELYSGQKLPYFFFSKSIPLTQIDVHGQTIEESIQFRRVMRVLEHYPDLPPEREIDGRDSRRIFDLVEARLMGRDDFLVLLQRMGPNHYLKIDGATRLAVLRATGAESVKAVFTLRGEEHFRR